MHSPIQSLRSRSSSIVSAPGGAEEGGGVESNAVHGMCVFFLSVMIQLPVSTFQILERRVGQKDRREKKKENTYQPYVIKSALPVNDP